MGGGGHVEGWGSGYEDRYSDPPSGGAVRPGPVVMSTVQAFGDVYPVKNQRFIHYFMDKLKDEECVRNTST